MNFIIIIIINNMTGHADVRLCKLGGGWRLVKWMYQTLFFSLSSQRSKKIITITITPDLRLSWTLLARQERKLNTFHVRCLCRMLNITWQDKVPNNTVLVQAEIPSMYTLLKQKRLRWLGHVARMDDGQIAKDLFYGELNQGERPTNRPQRIRCKAVCWRDLQALGIDIIKWETVDLERSAWRQALQQGPFEFEETLAEQVETKR